MTKRVSVTKLLPVDHPAPYEPVVAAGLKAMGTGTASEHQQRKVLDWLLRGAAGIGSQSFRGGDPYATAFAEGRRHVGIQIMLLMEMKEAQNG